MLSRKSSALLCTVSLRISSAFSLRCRDAGKRAKQWTHATFGTFAVLANAYGGNWLIVVERTGIAAGSPIPIDLMKQLIDKLNLTELTVAYGMSMSFS